MLSTSLAETTASAGSEAKSAIFLRMSADSSDSLRQSSMSGWMPMRRSSLTECCVGLVFSSPAWPMYGTSVRWMKRQLRRPTSTGNWRIASRNGSDSMSPTVPPISVMTTSTSPVSADQLDALLDLVGDVRDDLDGRAEVVAAALALDDRVVDPAGGDVRRARRVDVGEALVVAEVEVGLGAVLGDEDLAVLVGRHRAGVDVDVRVELLQADGEPAGDEQAPDRRGGDPLAEGRDDAAGDEDVARLARGVRHGAVSRVSLGGEVPGCVSTSALIERSSP